MIRACACASLAIPISAPIRRTRLDCCARAATGHATATPLTTVNDTSKAERADYYDFGVSQKLSDELTLSPKTVSVYRTRLLEKMKLRNNAELTFYVMSNRLVDLNPAMAG